MSNKTINNYPVQNGWLSDSANTGITAPPVNFQNTPGVPNFTNSSTRVPQSNYPISNAKPNPELCPPYNTIRHSNSFELQHPAEPISKQNSNPYNEAHNTNLCFNPQSNQGPNNFAPELTFERGFVEQAPPNYPFSKQNSTFDSGPPQQRQFTGSKNNFHSNGCLSGDAQPNLPPPNFPSNPPLGHCLPLEPPPPFHNRCYPTQETFQQQGNMPYNQNNCGPMYNVPPPTQGPMHTMNANEGPVNCEPNQSGQFTFGPPRSQTPMSFSSDKPFNQNQQFFSNLSGVLPHPPFCDPPPPFCDPPPYPFLIPPPTVPSGTQEDGNINQGYLNATVPNIVSAAESKLASFLQGFQIEKKVKPKIGITVTEFRSYLQKGFLLSKMMQIRRPKLMSLLQSSEGEWEEEMKTIDQIKHQLSIVCGVLSVPSNLSTVQRKLKLIKKKREIKMKLKQEASNMKLKREQETEALNQEIDKWLDTINEQNLKQKREIEMKKEADNILSEVRRKIQEAKKTIEKIKVFEKLRLVRQTNAEQKGLFSPPEQNALFEKKASDLRSLMHSQLLDYEAEEKALQVMLESEQGGQLEQEAEWRTRKGRALQLRRQRNILESLFGDAEEPTPEDPLFLFFQHHNSGNTTIENLVQIRHHWDVHLSDMGEAIPQQWVGPVPASNPSWEEVCKE